MGLFHETGMQPKKKEKTNTTAPGATGKKHTIKSRTKATTAFALRQVRDAIVAGGVLSALQNLAVSSAPTFGVAAVTGTVPTGIPIIGLAAIGVASFLGSKMVFKGTEKHIIKHRENGELTKKDAVKEALAVAAPITALLIGGFAPAAVVSIGVGAITLTKRLIAHFKDKNVEEKNDEVKTR